MSVDGPRESLRKSIVRTDTIPAPLDAQIVERRTGWSDFADRAHLSSTFIGGSDCAAPH